LTITLLVFTDLFLMTDGASSSFYTAGAASMITGAVIPSSFIGPDFIGIFTEESYSRLIVSSFVY